MLLLVVIVHVPLLILIYIYTMGLGGDDCFSIGDVPCHGSTNVHVKVTPSTQLNAYVVWFGLLLLLVV